MSDGIRLKMSSAPRRVALDAQLAVEEDRRDLGRRDQVLQVVVDLAGLVDLDLQLVVDGGQLLVHRLELFLAGLELFGRGAQLLVDGLQFLVGRLQLLGGRLGLLETLLQVLLLPVELRLEMLDDAARVALGHVRRQSQRFVDLVELDDRQDGAVAARRERTDRHVDEHVAAVPLQPDRVGRHAATALARLEERGAQLEPQLGMHDRDQVMRRHATGVFEEAAHPGRQVQQLIRPVDQPRSARRTDPSPGDAAPRTTGRAPLRCRWLLEGQRSTVERLDVGAHRAVCRIELIEALLPVERAVAARSFGVLGAAQHQMATAVERVAKRVEHLALRNPLDVDQQVAGSTRDRSARTEDLSARHDARTAPARATPC